MINIDLKAIFINYSALLCFMPMILCYVYITALVAVLIAGIIQHHGLNKYTCHGSAVYQVQWKGFSYFKAEVEVLHVMYKKDMISSI